LIVPRDEHLSPGPQIPASPSPFGGEIFGNFGGIGRDGDDFYPQTQMGMGLGGPFPIPISPFSPQIYGNGDGDGGRCPHPRFPNSPKYII